MALPAHIKTHQKNRQTLILVIAAIIVGIIITIVVVKYGSTSAILPALPFMIPSPVISVTEGKYKTFDGTIAMILPISDQEKVASITKAITLEAWCNPAEFKNYTSIVGVSSGKPPYGGWQLNTENRNNVNKFDIAININNKWFNLNDVPSSDRPLVSSLDTDTWYHVVGTYENGELKLYINGQQVPGKYMINNTDKLKTIMYADVNSPVTIGRNGQISGDGFNFKGKIGEIRIYNTALNLANVQKRYNDTKQNYK